MSNECLRLDQWVFNLCTYGFHWNLIWSGWWKTSWSSNKLSSSWWVCDDESNCWRGRRFWLSFPALQRYSSPDRISFRSSKGIGDRLSHGRTTTWQDPSQWKHVIRRNLPKPFINHLANNDKNGSGESLIIFIVVDQKVGGEKQHRSDSWSGRGSAGADGSTH